MGIGTGTVLIYRETLLPYSETFIAAQGEALGRYRAFYVGHRWGAGRGLISGASEVGGADRVVLLGAESGWGAVEKTGFKLGGWVPGRWRRSLLSLEPRLIHAHFGVDGVAALGLARRLGLPLVVTFHGYDATLDIPLPRRSPLGHLHQFWRHRGRFYQERYLQQRQRLFREAAMVIAVSQFIGDRLLVAGCPPEKLRVHYIGVDRRQLYPNPRVRQEREPVILFVGRLVEKKGCRYFLEAIAQVQEQVPEVRGVVIGDGPLRGNLEQQAREQGSAVTFLGALEPPQVWDWMRRAMVLCGPSVRAASGDAEGLGMVFAEAQTLGLPVVGFGSGGIPEVVTEGVSGLLVPEGDTTALGLALLRVVRSPELRERLARGGSDRMARDFDLHRNTAILEQLYDQVLGIKA